MKPIKTPLEAAAGKLISAIQKIWLAESGSSTGDEAEAVMHHSHDLLIGAKTGTIAATLAGGTVAEFLGEAWVASHSGIQPHVEALQRLV